MFQYERLSRDLVSLLPSYYDTASTLWILYPQGMWEIQWLCAAPPSRFDWHFAADCQNKNITLRDQVNFFNIDISYSVLNWNSKNVDGNLQTYSEMYFVS